jgi:SAM-dependent methyltransferase
MANFLKVIFRSVIKKKSLPYFFRNLYWQFNHVDDLSKVELPNTPTQIAYQLLSEKILVKKGAIILDFGCSNGSLLFHLQKLSKFQSSKMIGVDVNRVAIKFAKGYAISHGIENVYFYNSISNQRYDFLIVIATLLYLSDDFIDGLLVCENILLIEPISKSSTYSHGKNTHRSIEHISSLFNNYRLEQFNFTTNWDNDFNRTFCGFFTKL